MKRFYNDSTKGTKDNPIEINNDVSVLYAIPANAWYSFTCIKCKKLILRSFKCNRLEFYKSFLCGSCGREITMIQQLGVPHALQNKKCIVKMEYTNLNRYGKKRYMTFGSAEFKQNLFNKHGYKNYCNRKQIVKTLNDKFGGNGPFCSKEIKTRAIDSIIEKFGVDNVFKLKAFQEKSRKTMTNRYGVPYSGMSKELSDKANVTKLKLYGTINVTRKYDYYGVFFDSSWELAIWIYCIDHNIPIIRNPISFKYNGPDGEIHSYEPDFSIDGKLVEIKGDQYFKEDGTMHYPYMRLHHDSKELTYDEKKYMNDLYERKHQCGLSNGVEFWKESDCKKYIDYCNTKYPN